mmetsp:Transcript_34054/g.74920  ORF Transcript_34054/g.74920 Transcript_34054/m.74920 type:complete len:692 (+) Transcript_34054:125-2200(+)
MKFSAASIALALSVLAATTEQQASASSAAAAVVPRRRHHLRATAARRVLGAEEEKGEDIPPMTEEMPEIPPTMEEMPAMPEDPEMPEDSAPADEIPAPVGAEPETPPAQWTYPAEAPPAEAAPEEEETAMEDVPDMNETPEMAEAPEMPEAPEMEMGELTGRDEGTDPAAAPAPLTETPVEAEPVGEEAEIMPEYEIEQEETPTTPPYMMDVAGLKIEIQSLTEQIEIAKENKEVAREEGDDAGKKQYEAGEKELKKEKRYLETLVWAKEVLLSEDVMESINKSIDEYATKIEAVKVDIGTLANEKSGLRDSAKGAEGALDSLMAADDAALFQGSIDFLSAQLVKLKEQISNIDEKLTPLEANKKAMEGEMKLLAKRLYESMEAKVVLDKAAAAAAEKADEAGAEPEVPAAEAPPAETAPMDAAAKTTPLYIMSVDELTTEEQSLTAQIATAKADKDAAEDKYAKKMYRATEKDLMMQRDYVVTLIGAMNALLSDEEIAIKTTMIAEYEDKITAVRTLLKPLEEKKKVLEAMMEGKEGELWGVEDRLQVLRDGILIAGETPAVEIATLQESVDNLSAQIDTYEADIKVVKADMIPFREQIKELERAKNPLEEAVRASVEGQKVLDEAADQAMADAEITAGNEEVPADDEQEEEEEEEEEEGEKEEAESRRRRNSGETEKGCCKEEEKGRKE